MKFLKAGYAIGVCAVALALLWIGIFKFTPSEAAGIKGYVGHSFLLSWLYMVTSVQTTSNLIGIFEVLTGILLIASFFNSMAARIGGYASLIIFLTTVSFLFTTPGAWKTVDGVPITDFFVLKDLAFLAISLMVIGRSYEPVESVK